MSGECIVFLAKEWGQESTSCDQVFEQLVRQGNKVLWINSIATRAPNLGSRNDWARIWRKLKTCLGGLRQVAPSGWLYQPLFIPLPFSSAARKLNAVLIRWAVRSQMRKLGMKHPQLWVFQPNGAHLVGRLGECVSLYYCVDDWTHFAHLDGERIAGLERALLAKVDACFAASEPLVEAKRAYNPRTYLALHGVDYERFRAALDPETPVPADLAALPRPVIGFYGGIRAHIDQPLLAHIASRHPEWSLAIIGKEYADVSDLRRYPNIHFLGHRRYEELPAYCKGFDAAIIPYVENEFIRHANPIKLRQYLCAGRAVVSTEMFEVRRYAHLVTIARQHGQFVEAIEQALRGDSAEARRRRSEAMSSESWEFRIGAVCDRVVALKVRKA